MTDDTKPATDTCECGHSLTWAHAQAGCMDCAFACTESPLDDDQPYWLGEG